MATGDHDWAAAEVVTAANMDDYLQLQVVQQFATAAARDAALSTRKREGMVTYQIDTNTLTVYTGAAWSTVGPVHGVWTDITPVITQSGTVTYTKNKSSCIRVGRMVTWQYVLTVTGTGSASNLVTVSLPYNVSVVSDVAVIGQFQLFDASASTSYSADAVPAAAGTIKGKWMNATLTYVGTSLFTAALAAGDILSGNITYEAAADA